MNKEIRIIQISDYHGNNLINKKRLLRKIKKINPHIIALTGDMINDDTYDFDKILLFLRQIKEINTNVYSVSGNHESRSESGNLFKEKLEEIGIENLEYKCKTLSIEGNSINLLGLPFNINYKNKSKWYKECSGDFDILLSHSPKTAIEYDEFQSDLVLSGHMHGGQVRIPFIGAIVTPYGGLFPKYNKGLYKLGNSQVYVDSGLGNSSYPLRTFNRVQISYIMIKNKKSIY